MPPNQACLSKRPSPRPFLLLPLLLLSWGHHRRLSGAAAQRAPLRPQFHGVQYVGTQPSGRENHEYHRAQRTRPKDLDSCEGAVVYLKLCADLSAQGCWCLGYWGWTKLMPMGVASLQWWRKLVWPSSLQGCARPCPPHLDP